MPNRFVSKVILMALVAVLWLPLGASAERISLKVMTPVGTFTPALATPSYPLATKFRGVVVSADSASTVTLQIAAFGERGMIDPIASSVTILPSVEYTISDYLPRNYDGFALMPSGGALKLNTTGSIGTTSAYLGLPIADGEVWLWKVKE